MTKYSIRFAINHGTFEEAALFSDWIPAMTLVNFCDDLSNEIDNCTAVEAIDLETGVLVYGIYADEDTGRTVYEAYSDGEGPDNYDDNYGFDPYLGCYTDGV